MHHSPKESQSPFPSPYTVSVAVMRTLSDFISTLYSTSIFIFNLLLLESVILIRTLSGTLRSSQNRLISTSRYLQLIEEKNPTIRCTDSFRSERIECAICLSEYEEGEDARKLRCKHVFHRECLDRWLQQYWATCPICRMKVLPDEIVTMYRRQVQMQSNTLPYDGSDEEIVYLFAALHGSSLQLHRFF